MERTSETFRLRTERATSFLKDELFTAIRVPECYASEFADIKRKENQIRLSLAVGLGVVIYLAFIPLIWWLMPDIRVLDTAMRLGTALPLGIVAGAIILQTKSALLHQAAAGTIALLFSLWTCSIFSLTNAPSATVLITSNSIIILFVIVVMRLSLPFAACLALTIAIIQLIASLVIGGFPASLAVSAFIVNISIALAGLYTSFELENEKRRSFLLAVRDRERLEELDERNRELDKLSETDALTGLLNRRALDRFMSDLTCERPASAVACLMIDVDNFKPYNDNYGHLAGDEVLVRIADALKTGGEGGWIAYRFGGEEFALLRVFETVPDLDVLKHWAQTVRERIEALAVPHAYSSSGDVVTVSAGVAIAEDGRCLRSALGSADRALYEAKSNGRNRIVCAPRNNRSNWTELRRPVHDRLPRNADDYQTTTNGDTSLVA